ncbi:hypothetical protein, partial [Salmonella sp. s60093]|uniref:hypothetical protein n=1 Tax=Salmonella sp. s60093 TaxID=3159721 RepID=UPI00397FFEA1
VKRPSKLTEEYNVIGEALIPVARPIKKVKDLSDLEKEQIKKLAANDNVCVIFIYYDKSFRKDKIYCFWGRDK